MQFSKEVPEAPKSMTDAPKSMTDAPKSMTDSDAHDQLTFEGNSSYKQYEECNALLRKGAFDKALTQYYQLLENKIELENLYYEIKYAHFWTHRLMYFNINNVQHKIECLQKAWCDFEEFVLENKIPVIEAYHTIKTYVHEKLTESLIKQIQQSKHTDINTLLLLSKHMIEAKDYHNALETLTYAEKLNRANALVYLYLGYAHEKSVEDNFQSHDQAQEKMVFYYREAFFWNIKQNIALQEIKSPMLLQVIFYMKNLFFADTELILWLPIYAYLYKNFTTKTPVPEERISRVQAALQKHELNAAVNQKQAGFWQPILINSYLYLYSHYKLAEGKQSSNLNILKAKIQAINPSLYQQLALQ